MNLEQSLIILELNEKYNKKNIYQLSSEELRKSYHIMALNYHPDKNHSKDSTDQFQNIQNAYVYLNNFINDDFINDKNDYFSNDINDDAPSHFINLIMNFLQLIIMSTQNNQPADVPLFQKECIDYSSQIIHKLLDKLNSNVLYELYNFIHNTDIAFFQSRMNISENIVNQLLTNIKNIIFEKMSAAKSSGVYILNPGLENLFNSEIYKLEINDDIIYIPLWHSELNYDTNIIKVDPVLSENITIDEKNNLYYEYFSTYEKVVDLLRSANVNTYTNDPMLNIEIPINIENDKFKTLSIPINEIRFMKKQTYIFKGIGIPKINLRDVFDNSIKGNIIIIINLE